MITSVQINNINSISSASLSFEKAKYKFREEYLMNNSIANPIAFYGRNGSGKSSFLAAIRFVINLLISEPNSLIPFTPNLSKKYEKKDSNKIRSSVSISMELEGEKYIYTIETSYQTISEEVLKKNGEVLFLRKGKDCSCYNKEYIIESKFYPALRFLASELVDQKDIYNVFEYLSNITYIGADIKKYLAKSMKNVSEYDVIVNSSSEVRKILEDYKSFPVYDIFSNQTPTGEKQYSVKILKDNGSFIIPYDLMSSGMRNQSFILSVLLGMPKNGVLIVDELEDALHPLTIVNFLKYAISKGIQIVFSSHNTSILSLLRPDNIVFANWKNGESSYKRLSDIYPNIREVNNIEKMYLNSTFDEDIEK